VKAVGSRGVVARKVIVAIIVILSVILAALIILNFWGFEFLERKAHVKLSHELLATAKSFEKSKKWDEGIAYFEKEVRKYPASSQAYSSLALMYLEKGEVDRALPAAEKSMQLNPRNARAFSILGICYQKKGDLSRATTLLQKAVMINPGLLSAHYKLAEVLARRGFLPEAMSQFDRAKKMSPGLSYPPMLMGRYEANRKNYQAAVKYEQSALKEDPNNTAAYCYLGQIYLEMGDYDGAIQNYEIGMTTLPEDGKRRFQSIIYNGMGIGYYRKKNFDRAVWAFSKSLEFEDAAAVHRRLGDAYMKQGITDKALAEYERAKQVGQGNGRQPKGGKP
jgi:tetratricopeptide (TPR) repeat protein